MRFILMTPPSNPANNSSDFTPDNFQTCLKLLQALSEDPTLFTQISDDDRILLMRAMGELSHPTKEENRLRTRARRKQRRKQRKEHDRTARAQTMIREARQVPVFEAPKQIEANARPVRELKEPQGCYVCKTEYTRLHFFYDSMCEACGDFNYQKRFQSAPLKGRTAIVTGGRVKIGYHTALKLLRAGARTIVTTRFPNDAALRFSREEDFTKWKDRLQVYGLDLRHSPSVEIFARYICNSEDRLDVLVNNAAQTVRKPPGFYRHLMEWEAKSTGELPEALQPLLQSYVNCKRALESVPQLAAGENIETTVLKSWPSKKASAGISASAQLSMIPYDFDEDVQTDMEIFPQGTLDADLQQVDLRSINTWRLALADVSTPEMLEVHLVNAVAPFILAAKLKPLMLRNPTGEQHIINASAMEGKFTRYTKTDKHPHTNMAKAALNMMTLTSAPDYAKSKIYMNAVDTGWITDEDPAQLSQAKKEVHDFEPPLDIVDGAARLLDPLFSGILTGEHVFGKFLKDYKPTDW